MLIHIAHVSALHRKHDKTTDAMLCYRIYSDALFSHSILKHAPIELSNAAWWVITPHPENGRPSCSRLTYVLVARPRTGLKPRRNRREYVITRRTTLSVGATRCSSFFVWTHKPMHWFYCRNRFNPLLIWWRRKHYLLKMLLLLCDRHWCFSPF